MNQHVPPTFRFSTDQFARMREELQKRKAILKELAPWPDPNYAVDDNWASVYPYASNVHAGDKLSLSLRILNHAPERQVYRVKWNIPDGWKIAQADREISLAAHETGEAHAAFTVQGAGLRVITADVGFAGRELREWTEALVRIQQ